jgi:5-formyltetrahydrofolate cyclo-ligase
MVTWDIIRQWRKAQRARLRAQRAAVPHEQHHDWSVAITNNLIAGFPMLKSMTVGFYWPFGGEFDPRFAIRRFREAGAVAVLPVVIAKGQPLQFREWWPGVETTQGVFDLPVPQGTRVLTPQAVLIPPVGFDGRGYRLGYGGGYFDRTLPGITPQPLKIAVAFELSRLETIYPQPHDVLMDFVVTEAGIHYVGPDGLRAPCSPQCGAELAARILSRRHPARVFDAPFYGAGFDLAQIESRQPGSW